MTKYVAIMSAKGGVGKTAITINLTQALVGFGRKAIAVDADLTAPNISVQLGMPQLNCTLHDVLNGKGTVQDCIYQHPSGIPVIGGRLAYELNDEVNYEKFVNLLTGLENRVEIVLIDAPPGMGSDARTVLQAVNSVIVITTPELPSVTDSRKTIKLAREMGKEVIGVLLNEVRNEQYEMTKENVEAFLGTRVIAVIPDDPAVRVAIYKNYPVVLTHPDSMASVAIKKLAAGLIGERYEAKAPEPDVKSVREKILEHLGLNE